ncbi:MAG: hypothetical protein WEK74_16245, partial [Hydrogenophaga sp.]
MTTPSPAPIEDIDVWLAGFLQPTVWVELAALAACIVVAWGASSLLRKALGMQEERSSVLFGRRVADGNASARCARCHP